MLPRQKVDLPGRQTKYFFLTILIKQYTLNTMSSMNIIKYIYNILVGYIIIMYVYNYTINLMKLKYKPWYLSPILEITELFPG